MAIIHGRGPNPMAGRTTARTGRCATSKRHGEVARGGRRHPHILFGGKGNAASPGWSPGTATSSTSTPHRPTTSPPRTRASAPRAGHRPRPGQGGVLGHDRRAGGRDRRRPSSAGAGPAGHDRSGWGPTATHGWLSGAVVGSWERRTRPWSGCARSKRLGTQRLMLQDLLPRDLDHVRLIGRIFAEPDRRRSRRGDVRYTRPLGAAAHLIDRPMRPRGGRESAHPGSTAWGAEMPDLVVVVVAAIAAAVGIAIGFVLRRVVATNAVKHAEHYSERLVAEARAKQKEIVLEGKDEALHLRRAAEEEARETRATLQRSSAASWTGRRRSTARRPRSRSGRTRWPRARRSSTRNARGSPSSSSASSPSSNGSAA